MVKKPWWATIQGAPDAAKAVAQYNSTPDLQRAWRIANNTRLMEDPELGAAVLRSGMDYSTARRVAGAYGAAKASKLRNLVGDAGLPASYVDPYTKQAAEAADSARKQKEDRGFWGSVGGAVSTVAGGAAGGIWDAGKAAFQGTMKGLTFASGPLTAPIAAGRADEESGWKLPGPLAGTNLNAIATLAQGVVDFAQGVPRIVAPRTAAQPMSDPQKADMRRAGYDPDSWTSRYAWYLDQEDAPGRAVSDQAIKVLKQEFNTHKVDLAREVVTSGVLDDLGRREGLSPDAQKFMATVEARGDDEGEALLKKLHDHSQLSFGGRYAEHLGLELGTGGRAAYAAGADLAAFWYLDPLVVAGSGAKALRYARGAIIADPEVAKAAIAGSDDAGNALTVIGKRWDDVIDRVDRIAVSREVGDADRYAKEFGEFRRLHPDLIPMYDTLIGLREGTISAAAFDVSRAVRTRKVQSLTDMTPIRQVGVTEPARSATSIYDNAVDAVPVEASTDVALRGVQATERDGLVRATAERLDRVPALEGASAPGTPVAPGVVKPLFKLRTTGADEAVDQASRADARAAVADAVADQLLALAIASGSPMVRNQVLLPGAIRVSSRVRNALSPMTGALADTKLSIASQLAQARGKGVVSFSDDVSMSPDSVTEVLTSAAGGKWVREHYTKGGLRARFARSMSRAGTFTDGAVLTFDDSTGTKSYGDFVRFFMPRAQGDYLAAEWARRDVGGRKALWENTVESIANARMIKDNPAGRDFWSQMLKGHESIVRPGQVPLEAYSSPAVDLIQAGPNRIAAAMYGTQMSDGVRLPLLRDVIRHTERVGLFGFVTKSINGNFVDKASRVLKVGQVATTSNMMRQALEGRAWQWFADPAQAVATTKARLGVAGATAKARVDVNDATRAAKRLVAGDHVDELAVLAAGDDATAYLDRVAELVLQHGGNRRLAAINRMMESGVDLRQLASARSSARLALSWTADVARRLRAAAYSKYRKEYIDADGTDPWGDLIDGRAAAMFHDGTVRELGGLTDDYAHGSGMVDDLSYLNDGLGKGFRVSQVKLKNTFGYLGTAGDRGAQRWADALNTRLVDPVGREVARALAHAARGQDFRSLDPLFGDAGRIQDVAYKLMRDSPLGEKYRTAGARAKYVNGKAVSNPTETDEALRVWADDLTADMVRYLGGKMDDTGVVSFEDASGPLLKKLAGKGEGVTLRDLAAIPADARPAEVASRIFVPRKLIDADNAVDAIGDVASKAYRFVVSGPLQRLVHDPQMIAAHHQALDAMRPLRAALKERGMSDETAYNALQGLAYQRAANTVLGFNDNPRVQSYFSSLVNNFFFYERATEDFVRRFMRINMADPAVLARAHLTLEAAEHSGVVYRQKTTDDEGNSRDELMFTWPASGLMTRTVNGAAIRLGLADDDVIKHPVWTDFSSPVRYLNASLSNPVGFTTSPLVGLPFRIARDRYEPATPLIDSMLATMEGGERSFATQSLAVSFMPSTLKRIVNAANRDDQDSQYASAMRNAMAYLDAAGKMPGADSSPAERQLALDELDTTIGNILWMRAIFGAFAPATPGTFGNDLSDIGEQNAVDQLRGVRSVRGEFFSLVEEMTKKHGPDVAFAEANIEWLRRGHGSVVHPAAFEAGSTKAPGAENDAGAQPSNLRLTQWMLDNKEFLKTYGESAYRLLPTIEGEAYYSSIGYRVQLRTQLREHKDLNEFYDGLLYADVNAQFYAMSDRKDAAMELASTPQETNAIWREWNAFESALVRNNPAWDKLRMEKNSPERAHADIAPAVQKLAAATDLPAEVAELQPDLRVMAQLYADYRADFLAIGGRTGDAFSARKTLNTNYRTAGNELFDGTPLQRLWRELRVYEDE